MKRLAYAIAALMALSGCEPQKVTIVELNNHGHRIESANKRCFGGGVLEIVEMEGHEYVLFRCGKGCGITHSGGCGCRIKKGE